jgi:protein-S-isoprenylcysteine O-methyltransferase Ste14
MMEVAAAQKSAFAAAAFGLCAWGLRDRHRLQPGDTPRDRWWSPRHRSMIVGVVVSLAGLLIWYLVAAETPARQPWSAAEAAALAASLGGSLLRNWAMRTLGRFFTFEVAIRQKHRLLGHGPYRFLRHPSYTGAVMGLGGLLWLLGGPVLVLRDWRPWAVAVPLGVAVIGESRGCFLCAIARPRAAQVARALASPPRGAQGCGWPTRKRRWPRTLGPSGPGTAALVGACCPWYGETHRQAKPA